jgi:hypothetical protein
MSQQQVSFWCESRYGWVVMLFGTYCVQTLDKSLTVVCLGSPGRGILITWVIHRPLRLVSVYWELKWLSRGTLRQAGLLSGAIASDSCRKNIGLSKLTLDSTLYRKVAERRGILSFFWCDELFWSFGDIQLGMLRKYQNMWIESEFLLLLFWRKTQFDQRQSNRISLSS